MGTLPGEPLWIATNYHQSTLLHQRAGPGNRSPVESPPVAKKLLKATTSSMPSGGLQFMPAPVASGKENRSILKRVGGTATRSKSLYGPSRKVNFEQSVAVVVYDPTDGDYVCSESQQLNVEPKDRREFVNRTLLGRMRGSQGVNRVGGPVYRSTDASSSGRPLPPINGGAQDSSPIAAASDVDFSFYEDTQGQLRLKFTVPLGPGVAAGDALVKANVAGNKVRVMATRTLASRDSAAAPIRQQFASRFALPMDVDPYGITARMDANGNLFVEAPVLSSERRRALVAEKMTTRASSVQTNSGARIAA
jgi:hypothetical protein